ncbi:MAG: hypothetical protein IJZ79_03805 [Bacilli bacterium]|nr:hypothetical protein [Bacilli bacterium]MBQ8218855.1 hypothetical protein [Bacilli bacterium]
MEFTKGGFNEFREDVMKALEEVAKKHEVTIKLGNISYNEFEFDMKIHVSKGSAEEAEYSAAKFNHSCRYYGFEEEDYFKDVVIDGRKFKFVGFNTKARKNVCKILDPFDNKIYVCSSMTVHRALQK